MGKNIHACIEWKIDRKDGLSSYWARWAELHMSRNLDAFSRMDAGGYTFDGTPFKMRGLPEDADYNTRQGFTKYECTETTWLNRYELATIAFNLQWRELDAVLLAMEALDVRDDYTRLVYGFYY